MGNKRDRQGKPGGSRLGLAIALATLGVVPMAAAEPVYLEYRCLLGGKDPGSGVFVGWESQEVDRLLAPKPAAPESDRMAPRRLRLPLYTDTSESEQGKTDPGPASPARGR